MEIKLFPSEQEVALAGATLVADEARRAVEARGRFVFAVSGGRTPWKMLALLAEQDVPWPDVYLVQVDERVAPAGHADRNLTHLEESLLSRAPVPLDHVLAMPVDDGVLESGDPQAGAAAYAEHLERVAGRPAVLDLIHLGLGPDGHTASLVPGDGALDVDNADVAVCGVYQGRLRMTLTYPLLNRARRILWLATGESKQQMLVRLLAGDPAIPAGRVRADGAVVFADRAAATLVGDG